MIKLTHVFKTFDGGRSYAVKDLSLSGRRVKLWSFWGHRVAVKPLPLK